MLSYRLQIKLGKGSVKEQEVRDFFSFFLGRSQKEGGLFGYDLATLSSIMN